MTQILRGLLLTLGLLAAWEALVWMTGVPAYILPPPSRVLVTLVREANLILGHAWVTLLEIILGLIIGSLLGGLSALSLTLFKTARRWLLPILVISQALPVFALAPLLVLWLGYGLASKVAMAVLIIYFPVTAAFYDGLRRTEPGWLELGQVMGASSSASLLHIAIPSALPALASGLRIAAATAPIGAVVGEWVGSSAGLGHLMILANARSKIDLLFAALLVLASMALLLYGAVDRLGRRMTPWVQERSEL